MAIRADFQSIRDTYFFRLEACTFAVVIGVFIEESEYLLSWKRVRQRIPLRFLLPTHRFETWVRRLSKTGWVLILLGVAGEFAYEAYVSRADGWLQDFSNARLAAAQREAADAIGEAGRAVERAAVLEKEAATLRKQIAHRHLTMQQRVALRNGVSSIQVSRILVTGAIGDTEAMEYGEELAGALSQSGIKVDTEFGRYSFDASNEVSPSGLLVVVRTGASTNVHHLARALIRAIALAGIPVGTTPGNVVGSSAMITTEQLELRVCVKP